MFTITENTKVKDFYDNNNYRVIQDIQNFITDNPGITILKILQSESISSEASSFNFSITIFYEDLPH